MSSYVVTYVSGLYTVSVNFDDAAINHSILHICLTADFFKDSSKAPCPAPTGIRYSIAKFLG